MLKYTPFLSRLSTTTCIHCPAWPSLSKEQSKMLQNWPSTATIKIQPCAARRQAKQYTSNPTISQYTKHVKYFSNKYYTVVSKLIPSHHQNSEVIAAKNATQKYRCAGRCLYVNNNTLMTTIWHSNPTTSSIALLSACSCFFYSVACKRIIRNAWKLIEHCRHEYTAFIARRQVEPYTSNTSFLNCKKYVNYNLHVYITAGSKLMTSHHWSSEDIAALISTQKNKAAPVDWYTPTTPTSWQLFDKQTQPTACLCCSLRIHASFILVLAKISEKPTFGCVVTGAQSQQWCLYLF